MGAIHLYSRKLTQFFFSRYCGDAMILHFLHVAMLRVALKLASFFHSSFSSSPWAHHLSLAPWLDTRAYTHVCTHGSLDLK